MKQFLKIFCAFTIFSQTQSMMLEGWQEYANDVETEAKKWADEKINLNLDDLSVFEKALSFKVMILSEDNNLQCAKYDQTPFKQQRINDSQNRILALSKKFEDLVAGNDNVKKNFEILNDLIEKLKQKNSNFSCEVLIIGTIMNYVPKLKLKIIKQKDDSSSDKKDSV